MHTLHINAQSYSKVSEIFPEEPENIELMIEDAASLILADLFEEAIVDDISVRFSPPARTGHRDSAIHIQAQCTLESFTLVPRTLDYIQLAVEEGICAILKELFGPVTIQKLVMEPSAA
ncbi:MAG TPA: hypothetical protein VJO32_03770 [Ktedonobacteraceae bacterium]|nr:hypothetical protein [Ktedonobacteraceae bacterium]